MAKLFRRVMFTGARTGLDAYSLSGYGRVERGESIVVPEEVADRYVTKHATKDGKEASDFRRVGGAFERTGDEPPPDIEAEESTEEEADDQGAKEAGESTSEDGGK